MNFLDSGDLNRESKCINHRRRCHHRGWWFWRRRHCRYFCLSVKRKYSESITIDEIKTKLEDLNRNFTLEEEENAFQNLSFCLRFNFRRSSAYVNISIDGVATTHQEKLTTWSRWRWVEAEYNITAASQIQVNSVDFLYKKESKKNSIIFN